MSRTIRLLAIYALAAAGVASLVFLSACGVSSTGGGGTGRVNVLVTDAPSDDWQEVTVQLKSIALRNQADKSWTDVWTGDPNAPTTLNLVDLSGVTGILNTATGIPAATYDRLKLVINPDPATMKLVDDAGNTISTANITVVDPSGKGEIKVDITPALTVTDGTTANLQVDFDLAHPLSIFVLNGKVVINLQIRHKAVPRNLKDLQFARTIGTVTAADTAGKASFTLKTLEGAEVLYGVNGDTIYVDVDANAAGGFDGLAALVGSTDKGALVASNMNANGTFYARRVWYGTIAKLPQFTPEGLVRRVGDNWIKVLNKSPEPTPYSRLSCNWNSDVIYVNDATVWTFHDTIPMGTGTAVLRSIRRGFRVSVEYVDATATPKVAESINVQSAHDEGPVRSVVLPTETTPGSIIFGGGDYCQGWTSTPPPDGGLYYSHEWPLSTITDHAFSWWFFGLPSSASTKVQDLADTVNQAKTAGLRVFARAQLYWDQATSRWVVEDLVLAPEKLREPTRITTGYLASSGSIGVATFDWDNESLPVVLTVYLDTAGNLQTVVGLYSWDSSNRVLTSTFPVLPGQWESVLTPSLWAVKVWVRPVKGTDATFTWHAYTVIGYRVY